MEKGRCTAALACDGEAAGKLPSHPCSTCIRKGISACFGRSSIAAIRYQSANDLSAKTIINVLETFFAVLRYAKKCGMRTSPVSFSDLTVKAPETRASVLHEQTGWADHQRRQGALQNNVRLGVNPWSQGWRVDGSHGA